MDAALRIAGLASAAVALATIALLAALPGGTPSCELYCGPGTILLPIVLMPVAPSACVVGLLLALVDLVRSRARSPLSWVTPVACLLLLGWLVSSVI